MVRTKASVEAEKKQKADERSRRYNEVREKQLEKRNEVRRNLEKKRRKHSKVLPVVMLIIVSLGVVTALSLTVLFKINNIEISGKTRYTVEELTKNSGVAKGDNLIAVDTGRISSDLMNRLPYIGKVEIKRSLPSVLKIIVTDAVPEYIFKSDSGIFITDKNYRVLDSVTAVPKGNKLTVIKGMTLKGITPCKTIGMSDESDESNDTKNLANLSKLIKSFETYSLTGISEINVARSGDIRFTYASRIECKLGSTANIDYKIKFAKKVLSEKLEKTDTGTLDLTAANTDSIYFKRHALISDSSKESSKESSKTVSDAKENE